MADTQQHNRGSEWRKKVPKRYVAPKYVEKSSVGYLHRLKF